jgi:hypothetical protein
MNPITRHKCRCGASRKPSESRCQKCRDRARWNRRKAWRCHKSRTQQDKQGSDLS